MRTIFTLLLFLQIGIIFDQIPPGYYDSTLGYAGDSLKSKLYSIIKSHIEFPYTSSNTDVWDILKETDKDSLNPNNVILLYSGWSVDGDQEYNSGQGWTREHVWAKSHGNFGTTMGAGTDVHALRPCDVSVNTARSNRWFAECSEQYVDGDGPTDSWTSSTDWIWEPRDQVKGDVARMIFYMATRYEGEVNEPDLMIIDSIPSDNNTDAPVHAKLSDLLIWHREDPVDDWERNRNDIIYYDYQNNRNPFIDHPEFAEIIWGNPMGLFEGGNFDSRLLIYPNPTNGETTIVWKEQKSYSIHIFNMAGQVVYYDKYKNQDEAILRLTHLSKGIYKIQALGNDEVINGTIIIK